MEECTVIQITPESIQAVRQHPILFVRVIPVRYGLNIDKEELEGQIEKQKKLATTLGITLVSYTFWPEKSSWSSEDTDKALIAFNFHGDPVN